MLRKTPLWLLRCEMQSTKFAETRTRKRNVHAMVVHPAPLLSIGNHKEAAIVPRAFLAMHCLQ